MATATRRGTLAVVTLALLLVFGAVGGIAIGDAMGTRPDPSIVLPGGERADTDLVLAWAARILLVLALAWVLIGMLAARTRLVRRPGAAAARASWIASTRPWRARESTLGMLTLDRALLVVVPAALLVATRIVETSFLSWSYLAVVFGAWLAFAVLARLLIGRRSPYPLLAAVGGVIVLRCIVTLLVLSFTGPGGVWFAFWSNPFVRVVYVAVVFALFVWVFLAGWWALSRQFGRRGAAGIVLTGIGAGLVVPAVIVGFIGLERALTQWNDELGLLPWRLTQMLGGIPDATPWVVAVFGAIVFAAGLGLALVRRGAASVP